MAQAKGTRKPKKENTTDRGGLIRTVLGCLLAGIGMGWCLGLTAAGASAWVTLRLFRDSAQGLGGVLCGLLPPFALWGGGLLCMSARRRISGRIYLSALGIYFCVMALLTLVTSVGSRQMTLINYIANGNRSVLGIVNNTSYGACLRGAYNLRAFYSGQLAGGGMLGMLVAYPVYIVFNVAGGVVLLILVIAVLLVVLLRLNPMELVNALSNRRYRSEEKRRERRQAREAEAAAQAQAEAGQQMPAPAGPIPVTPLIPPQNVHYTGTSVQSDPEESWLVPEQTPPGEEELPGFTPVPSGDLYEEHIPILQDAPAADGRRRRAGRTGAEKEAPAAAPQPSLPKWAQPRQGSTAARPEEQRAQQPQAPARPRQDIPQAAEDRGAETPVRPVRPSDTAAAAPQGGQRPQQPVSAPAAAVRTQPAAAPARDVRTQPEQQPAPQRPAAQAAAQPRTDTPAASAAKPASGRVQPVYTDPAVPLDGKKVSITGQNNDRPGQDPFEAKHTRTPMQAPAGDYHYPPLSLLQEKRQQRVDTTAEDDARAKLLEHTLASFNITAHVEYVVHGPAITRFALRLAEGVNVNRLGTISNNLAMTMKAIGLRIEVPIPGTSLVGIEVPNEKISMVTLKEVLDSDIMRANPSPTAVAIGKDITGQPILCELSDMPHMLIAGATGSGKSVCINSIIQSILYRATPQQVRMLMIDPKLVELQPYNGIPHLLTEVVSDPKKAAAALDWLVEEMGDRYRRFQQIGVRNISGYNRKMTNPADRMPDIVAIIDEFSDLMVQCRKQVEESIQRLAALARAAGIYMIVATQRPSVDVITGVIKANIPSRIAFAVANNVDSRTIIDSVGAEKLLGKGDMLYFPRSEFRPIRVQGCFVSDSEVQEIAEYVKSNNEALYDDRISEHMENATREEEAPAPGKEPDYEHQPDTENEMLQRAIEMAVESGQMSISMLRRRLGLGHSRAGKLIDTMAQMGIVSQDEGPKPRRTLITREDYLKMQAEIMDQ